MPQTPSLRFAGRTVLITGGGTGMGKAAALRFGREGANVVIAGRRAGPLQDVAASIAAAGGSALAIPADVADPEQVAALVRQTVATFGALHMAWNNAGVLGAFAPIQDMEMAEFDDVMATNLRGVFACLKCEIGAMLEAGVGGAIVNTSSWTAHGAMPGLAAYAGAKAALDAMTRTAAVELGAQQIRINNVSPGIIATPMASGVLATETAALPFRQHTPLQRIGQPEEVADAVVWLLSDEARFVTGQSLLIDGGFTLGGLRPWFRDFVAAHT
ncbi:SDR family NAD(P)-dependent oxidoreductase [Massilia sp. S19_KUP03_FR1]|uniref:SDR family NAD(P)-dependent oxidoreductase n=1 Tax=Massilia sp. S19_KUP03_FR1 TaxID=3025503 RepID=UPI002FCCC2ED